MNRSNRTVKSPGQGLSGNALICLLLFFLTIGCAPQKPVSRESLRSDLIGEWKVTGEIPDGVSRALPNLKTNEVSLTLKDDGTIIAISLLRFPNLVAEGLGAETVGDTGGWRLEESLYQKGAYDLLVFFDHSKSTISFSILRQSKLQLKEAVDVNMDSSVHYSKVEK